MDEDSLITSVLFECLKERLESQGCEKTFEDGGQSHFVGWEYQARYERDGAVITLIQGERYGQPYYTYEANPKALVQMNQFLQSCEQS